MKEYILTTQKCMLLVKKIRWFGPAWLVNLISILLAHHTRREQSNSLKKNPPNLTEKTREKIKIARPDYLHVPAGEAKRITDFDIHARSEYCSSGSNYNTE